jgi:hypothetical protein
VGPYVVGHSVVGAFLGLDVWGWDISKVGHCVVGHLVVSRLVRFVGTLCRSIENPIKNVSELLWVLQSHNLV